MVGPVRWSELWLKLAEKHCSGWIVVREKHCSGWKNKPNKPNLRQANGAVWMLFWQTCLDKPHPQASDLLSLRWMIAAWQHPNRLVVLKIQLTPSPIAISISNGGALWRPNWAPAPFLCEVLLPVSFLHACSLEHLYDTMRKLPFSKRLYTIFGLFKFSFQSYSVDFRPSPKAFLNLTL